MELGNISRGFGSENHTNLCASRQTERVCRLCSSDVLRGKNRSTHSYADTHRHLIIEHAIEHPNSSVVFRTICH